MSRATEFALQRDGCCLYGFYTSTPCWGGLDPHHIVFVSQGGKDEKENIITLCRKHHDLTQAHRIEPGVLFEILSKLYGYTY